ncbi:hypothetical protein, partial [Gelidibacter sp.]|uniref:hypothetical protein n=1 Tax=Gelidibacter sp. TaxID=2018083 RepID=UPI003266E1DA
KASDNPNELNDINCVYEASTIDLGHSFKFWAKISLFAGYYTMYGGILQNTRLHKHLNRLTTKPRQCHQWPS